MPAVSPTSLSLLGTLVARNTTTTTTTITTTTHPLHVICAWPVSGQYGPGSRILYYVLIAACVLARKREWLRNACLAAALLVPAVASIHGIVLAAVHVNDAVDMDIYGAFQICSIGILAAPLTVRLSRTYDKIHGRNLIFLWTLLVLAGLLSLGIQFFRIVAAECRDESGHPMFTNVSDFDFGTTCGLICSVDAGPFSPLRRDSANNIYVIPVPDKLTFATATLLAAACCVPAILSLITMWNRILRNNWKTRFGRKTEDEHSPEPIEDESGTNIAEMRRVNNLIRRGLKAIEVYLFGAAVLAIIVFGERNFFSIQVNYMTEPIVSVGQWAPVVGTGLATLGSLYLLFSSDIDDVAEVPQSSDPMHHCNCSTQHVHADLPLNSPQPTTMSEVEELRLTSSPSGRQVSIDGSRSRRNIPKVLTATVNYLSTAAPERFDDSEFRRGKAIDFPVIPGEENRNRDLVQIQEQYNPVRDADGNATPSFREHSRASSIRSVVSSTGPGNNTTEPRPGGSSPVSASSRPRASTVSVEGSSFEHHSHPLASTTSAGSVPTRRRDTLEVPPLAYHSPRLASSISDQVTPPIVVSPDSDIPSFTPPRKN